MLSLSEIIAANKLGDALHAAKEANAKSARNERVRKSFANAGRAVTHGEWEARRAGK